VDSAASIGLLAGAVLNIAIYGAVWLGHKKRRAYLLFRGLPVSSIRDAPEGTVHFRGRVLGNGPLLEAPLSGRRCVFHDVLIEEYSDTTGTLLRQLRGLRFRIADGTGTALIVFQGAGPIRARRWDLASWNAPFLATGKVGPGGQSSGYRTPPEEYVVEATEDAPLTLVKATGAPAG